MTTTFLNTLNFRLEAEEMVQQLRALIVLLEDLSSFSVTYVEAHNL